MGKSENEQISNSTSNPTSSTLTSPETAPRSIKIPVPKQQNSTNWLGVSDSCFFVGSPTSGEALRASLKLQKMLQNGGSLSRPSLLDGTAARATSSQNQDEVKPQDNPDQNNSDTLEAPDVFEMDL